MGLLRYLSDRLSDNVRNELKRWYYRYLIKRGRFDSDEPEYIYVEKILTDGDYAIDIGANVGTYTARFSQLVGIGGRVIAFEPIPQTFGILASNSSFFPNRNVTLINAAASDKSGRAKMDIPSFESGQRNYYQASIVEDKNSSSGLEVLSVPVDSLGLDTKIKLVKIDAEGHEFNVIMGMMNMIKRDKPILIIEGESPEIEKLLSGMGYTFEHLPQSPNRIYSAPV